MLGRDQGAELNIDAVPGVDWVDRLNKACLILAALGGTGTVLIPDFLEGNATTIGNVPSGVTVKFTGTGNFGLVQLNVGAFTKIYAQGATLTMLQANAIAINQPNFVPLQTNDLFVIDGLIINGAGLANTTGLFLGSSTGKGRVDNLSVTGCKNVGIRYDGAQFIASRRVHLYNNFVGFKNYSTAGGGGNSNTFSDWTVVDNTVGAIVSDLVGNLGMGGNLFHNSDFLSNAVALVLFGNSHTNSLHFYLGSPEENGTGGNGPATTFPLTIDGNMIPSQASFYVSQGRLELKEMEVAEATSNPFIMASNSSEIVLDSVSEYGATGGSLVLCDATSRVVLLGDHQAQGNINNVVAYPSRIGAKYIWLAGAPAVNYTATIPNAFTGNPKTPAFSDIQGAVSQATSVDPLYGTVNTVTFAASPGSINTNRANFGVPIAGAVWPDTEDWFVSLLVKASVNTTLSFGGNFSDNASFGRTPLVAGQWTLVRVLNGALTAGGSFLCFPLDSAGATVSFTGLQCLAMPLTSPSTMPFQQVLQTGAVNPNGH